MSDTGEKAAFKPTPVFRPARPDEAAALTEIALAAKQSWGYPDDWLAAWRADLTLTADYIRSQPVVVVELDGAIAGFCGLARKDGDWQLEHLWLRPGFFGRGLGRALFAVAVLWLNRHFIAAAKTKKVPIDLTKQECKEKKLNPERP